MKIIIMERCTSLVLLLCLAAFCYADDDHGTIALNYDTATFKEAVPKAHHFVMFFAPWCGHCKRLAPTFDQLAEKYNSETESEVTIAKVDCTVETGLCSDHEVTGYPTLKFFAKDGGEPEKYRGSRDFDALVKYIEKSSGSGAEEQEEAAAKPAVDVKVTAGLYELTHENFNQHVEKGHHFIKFYAPWCGHCKRLAPVWDDLGKTFEDDSSVKISKIDCTQAGAVCSNNGVRGYPTLMFFTNGKKVETYSGGRDHDSLRDFVNQQKSKTDPNADRTDEKVPSKTEEKEEKDEEKDVAEGLVILTSDNFKESIAGKKALLQFYAPWCPHCQRISGAWDDLAGRYSDNDDVVIGKMDCTNHRQTCLDNEVKGYPTILYFENGEQVEKYGGGRELALFVKFINQKLEGEGEEEEKEEVEPTSEHVIRLTEDTFTDSVATGTTFVKFYAPWCGHCKSLAPIWESLGESFKSNTNVKIAKVDCTTEKQLCKELEIEGFPTLLIYRNGEDIAEYDGARTLEKLKEYVLTKVPHDEL